MNSSPGEPQASSSFEQRIARLGETLRKPEAESLLHELANVLARPDRRPEPRFGQRRTDRFREPGVVTLEHANRRGVDPARSVHHVLRIDHAFHTSRTQLGRVFRRGAERIALDHLVNLERAIDLLGQEGCRAERLVALGSAAVTLALGSGRRRHEALPLPLGRKLPRLVETRAGPAREGDLSLSLGAGNRVGRQEEEDLGFAFGGREAEGASRGGHDDRYHRRMRHDTHRGVLGGAEDVPLGLQQGKVHGLGPGGV